MKFRLWYPQLDVYDSVRRLSALLYVYKGNYPTKERLYISDFYLANPPLLHKTHMPREVRNAFAKLSIPRPEAHFLNYPPAPLLFSKMANIQQAALQNLVGRTLIDIEKLRSDRLSLSDSGRQFAQLIIANHMDESERSLLNFLCQDFALVGRDEPGGLRTATGLRRVGL